MKTVKEIIYGKIGEEILDKSAKEFVSNKYPKARLLRTADGIRWFIQNSMSVKGIGPTEDVAWENAAERVLFNE